MSVNRSGSSFFRGFRSVFELMPTEARKAHRNTILEAHSEGIHNLWAQVGEMVRGEGHEITGESAESAGSKQVQAKSEAHTKPYLW